MAPQSIKKNTIFNAIKTVSSILFPLITFPYISRTLLAENVGKISFGSSIVNYFSLIATLGIQVYAIRECASVRENKEELSNIASQIFSINIVTTIISYILLAFTLVFSQKLNSYRILIIIQSLTIISTTLGADWLNSAMEDFKYITVRSVIFQFISLALMFIFVHQSADYIKYILICLVSSAGASICNIWYRRKYCKVRFIRNFISGIEWKKHFIPIFSLFVMILAQTILNSLDTTMLGIIHGDREVGIYSAAYKMSNIILQLVASLLWVIMPRMSSYFAEGNYDQINALLRKVLGFNAFLGLPCAVGTFMLSEELVLIISGKDFIEASYVLKILMLSFVFNLFGGCFLGNSILLPMKKEKTFMIVCCLSAIVNIVSNFIFIPKYGAIAAAGTTALCTLFSFIVLFFTIDKKIKIVRIPSLFITPIIGCIGIVMVCLACKNITLIWLRVVGSIIFSIFIYFFIAYIGKNELLFELINAFVLKSKRK